MPNPVRDKGNVINYGSAQRFFVYLAKMKFFKLTKQFCHILEKNIVFSKQAQGLKKVEKMAQKRKKIT